MESLKIGELARTVGVGVETVRYYERRGLLAEPMRRPSGYRAYGQDSLTRLRFIRRSKELGFTLKEVEELLALRHEPGHTCGEVSALARQKIRDVEGKILDLQKILRALENVAKTCQGRDRASSRACPVFDSLERKQGAVEAS